MSRPATPRMKACTLCGATKPTDAFTSGVARCKTCRAEYSRQYRAADPARTAAQQKAQYAKHASRRVAESRAWNEQHPERHRATMRRYMARNRDAAKKRTKEWVRANLKRKLAQNKLRAKRVRLATPPWVDREAIVQIYLSCPAGHDVDHIYPLKGKTSCGLHVPWNLQYLPSSINRQKHAKEPDAESGLRQRPL